MARGSKTTQDPAAAIRAKQFAPVYLVDGEERVLVDEAVELIRSHALEVRARDFNLDVLDGKQATAGRIVEVASMLPAFAPRRVVLVYNVDKLATDQMDPLVAYVEAPSPTTVLVLVASDKLDARIRLYKAVDKHGVTLRFSPPKAAQMPDAIRGRAKALGIAIEEPAVRALADAVGTDVSGASQALEVLELFVGPDGSGRQTRPITVSDVAQVVTVTKEESIFDLVDAIGSRNRTAALALLANLIQVSRSHPLQILALVARQYRHLIKARAALDGGAREADIQGLVGIPPFAVRNLVAQARRHPLPELAAGLGAIAATDRDLKGGRLDGHRAMERLVLRLMGVPPARRPR